MGFNRKAIIKRRGDERLPTRMEEGYRILLQVGTLDL